MVQPPKPGSSHVQSQETDIIFIYNAWKFMPKQVATRTVTAGAETQTGISKDGGGSASVLAPEKMRPKKK
jgi:hypothetical protein